MPQERHPSGIPAHHWLALCARTESDLAAEWPCIMWVIRGRVASPRYPDTYEAVILQPSQFSAFNGYGDRGSRRVIFDTEARRFHASEILAAADLAAEIVKAPASERPGEITTQTLHYYSPVSMVPKGSKPAWAKSAKRLYTPAGIDPERFVFAEGVP